MSYFCNCKKCGKEIYYDEFRFLIPEFEYNWICYDCFNELKEIIDKWLEEKKENEKNN